MTVYGNKGFDNPTHVTYNQYQDGLQVGLWSDDVLMYVFMTSDVISDIKDSYPNAIHYGIVNDKTVQTIHKVDFKKAEISKYFEIETASDESNSDAYKYQVHKKSNLVIAYAANQLSEIEVGQSHVLFGMLNSSKAKNSIHVHIVDNKAFLISNIFGLYKRIGVFTFDTAEDLLYQILYTFKQYGIPLTIPVVLSGGIDKSSSLAKLLKDFIPRLKWQSIPDNNLSISDKNSHLLYDMYLARQCV